jgi:hypothetical protein
VPAEPVSRTPSPPARGSASSSHSSRSSSSECRLVLPRRPLHESDAFCLRVKTASIPLVREHDGSEDAPFADVAVDSDCSNTFARNFVEYAVLIRHRPRVAGIDPLELRRSITLSSAGSLILTKSPAQSRGLHGGDRVLSGSSCVPIDRRRPQLRVSTNSASGHRGCS